MRILYFGSDVTHKKEQGRIQDLKKEGAQWLCGLAPKIILANLGNFLKNLGQKGVGMRPPLESRREDKEKEVST